MVNARHITLINLGCLPDLCVELEVVPHHTTPVVEVPAHAHSASSTTTAATAAATTDVLLLHEERRLVPEPGAILARHLHQPHARSGAQEHFRPPERRAGHQHGHGLEARNGLRQRREGLLRATAWILEPLFAFPPSPPPPSPRGRGAFSFTWAGSCSVGPCPRGPHVSSLQGNPIHVWAWGAHSAGIAYAPPPPLKAPNAPNAPSSATAYALEAVGAREGRASGWACC